MALLLSTSYVQTNVPGGYNQVTVQSSPVGTSSSGIILLIGEADGGPSYSQDATTLTNNFFGPSDFPKVQAKYVSGNIVEMMRGISAPANDPDLPGSANQILIAKTNSGTQAQATIDTNYGTLKDKNWGLPGNKYSYKIIAVQPEVAPTITGDAITSFASINAGLSFHVNLNGVLSAVTLPAGTYTTAAQVAAALVGLPANVTATGTATAPYQLTLTINPDAAANRQGYGKALELYDGGNGDLVDLGLSASLQVSSEEPEVELNVVRPDINANELDTATASVALTVGYQGTSATLTINATTLSTTVVGGSGSSFSVLLSTVPTMQGLANFINSQPGYTAAVIGSTQLATTALDKVTAIGICSSGTGVMPGRIKIAAYNWQQAVATSRYVQFAPTALLGLPTAMTGGYAYLTGGTKGGTASADVLNCLINAQGVSCNFVNPLFAQDASLDITAGLTDSSSTYTIASIHAATKSHVLLMSQIEMKRNREAMLAYEGTSLSYALTKNVSGTLATYRACLCFQDCVNTSASGTTQFQAWYAAGIASAMQSAGFYKSIVKKGANVISFVDPDDFDSGDPSDVSDALNAGLLFLENSKKGPRWVSDQTTYGFDTNFVYNSLQTTYIADIIDLTFTQDAENAFVGKSLADIDLGVVASFVTNEADQFKKLKLITSSDDAPLGYKNVTLSEAGPVLSIAVEFKPSSSIYFVGIQTNLSQVVRNS
jgi:hypothetical protein